MNAHYLLYICSNGRDVGELELDAVEEELVVSDGRRVVGHAWTMKVVETIGRGREERLNDKELSLYALSALPFLAVLLLAAFGRLFVTHDDLTGTAPEMTT